MARMIYTEGFLDDAAAIYSPRVRQELLQVLSAIETFPGIGSSAVPTSIQEQYGSGVLKAVIKPFDLVYEYNKEDDIVVVYGLVPFRAAR